MSNSTHSPIYMQRAREDVLEILSNDEQRIEIPVSLIRACGDIRSAIFLDQLFDLDPINDEGWIVKRGVDIEEETTLTLEQQSAARMKLRDRGLIEEHRKGMPARVHFRVNFPRVRDLVLGEMF